MISAILFHCLYENIDSSLVLDRLKGPDHHNFRVCWYPLPSFDLSLW